jgi:purine nucleosidase
MERRSIVIDTDTASDDAIALVLAVREPSVDVRAITVVAGNVPLDLAVRNAIVTLDLCGGAEIAVHAGRTEPLSRPLDTAQFVHGEDGMGGAICRSVEAGHLPRRGRRAAGDRRCRAGSARPGDARPADEHRRRPQRDPEFLTRFGHTYLMAGSPDGVGNVDALGEYNVWADPEAATIVFAAPGAKTMIGWNISRTFAVMNDDEQAQLAAAGPLGGSPSTSTATSSSTASTPASPASTCPIRSRWRWHSTTRSSRDATDEWLVVGLDGPTRGCTIPDRRYGRPDPNVRVVWSVDEAAFKRRLLSACSPLIPEHHNHGTVGGTAHRNRHANVVVDGGGGQRGRGRSPGWGPSVRVRLSSKNESTSIIVTSASHMATLFSVGDARDDRAEVADAFAVGVVDGDDRRADVVADEGEALVHARPDHGVPRLVVECRGVCGVEPDRRQRVGRIERRLLVVVDAGAELPVQLEHPVVAVGGAHRLHHPQQPVGELRALVQRGVGLGSFLKNRLIGRHVMSMSRWGCTSSTAQRAVAQQNGQAGSTQKSMFTSSRRFR